MKSLPWILFGVTLLALVLVSVSRWQAKKAVEPPVVPVSSPDENTSVVREGDLEPMDGKKS